MPKFTPSVNETTQNVRTLLRKMISRCFLKKKLCRQEKTKNVQSGIDVNHLAQAADLTEGKIGHNKGTAGRQ